MRSTSARVWGLRAAAVLLPLLGAAPASAQPKPTPLLEDNLASGKRTKIDGGGGGLDSALDDALGGPQSFSTKELEAIEDKIRAELKRDRPRATPRVIVYLYPGRIDVDKLKALPEVLVDIQLVMDPCERSVCRDAVGRHIEIVGRAVGQPSRQGPGHKLTFKNLRLETAVQMHDSEVTTYVVPIPACITASQKPGGGTAWLAGQDKAEQDYEPIVQKAVARHASARRVSLVGAPQVTRAKDEVGVTLKIKGDRSRVQQQVTDALAAAAEGLRDNPKTPREAQLEITVETGDRVGARRFRAPANPVGLYVDRQLDGGALWSSYVQEVKKQPGANTMSFDDAEASGKSPVGGGGDLGPADDNEMMSVIASNFGSIGGCAKAEAAKGGFKGVTITFKWNPDGRATNVSTKEPNLRNGALAKCLQGAVGGLQLPKFSGGAKEIEYPIRLK